ncbi:hypothetical protein SDC9_146247 [bioreactor metagenome]|uniref:DUF2628 domain-containing protein n=1 Tax=bioreactor metagenome TaxID=1076179 RepID=A0A645EAR9_9ZZZZ
MQQVNELNLFIQKNQNFYEEKFKKMDDSGKSISWNWSAFFMGIYWMIYRKMYFKAGAFFILSLVASYTPYIGSILNFAVLIGIGIYANALYQDEIRVNMEKIKGLLPEAKEIIAKKRGGTNLPLAIGLYAVHNIVAIIILVTVPGI